jgi:hypothetical protein
MDYQSSPGVNDNQKFVRFYIFGPSGQLLPSINLDGRGEKFMPGSCISCHGGDHYAGHFPDRAPGNADFGGRMLPYDKGNFAFSDNDGLDDQQREEAIYRLNQNLAAADPAAVPNVPGALTIAGQNLIHGWYANSNLPPHTLDQDYLPLAWKNLSNGFTNYPNATLNSQFYRHVMARACRTCHVNQIPKYNFDDTLYVNSNPNEFRTSTCVLGVMPNSLVTFNRYWLSRGTVDPVSGESTDMPSLLSEFDPYGFEFCGSPEQIQHY